MWNRDINFDLETEDIIIASGLEKTNSRIFPIQRHIAKIKVVIANNKNNPSTSLLIENLL